MSNVNFANIARLIITYNLELVSKILPDNLKCVKCKLVLKDACQVRCCCTFCRACIADLMASGSEFCPGVSKDCEESLLSDFLADHRANMSVSQLTVKCPQNGCVHECELAELEDHMRVCGRKSVACPFHELGCQRDKLAVDEMNEHLQQENRSHSEILIGMITDITKEMESHKREIEMLKRSDERRKRENEMLTHELLLKDSQIKLIMDQMGHMQNEIKSIKREENADLADRVRNLSEKIDVEIDERRQSDDRVIIVIEDVDVEIRAITQVVESNEGKVDRMIRSVKDDIRSINQNNIKSIIDDIDCIKSLVQSIQVLVGLGQIDVSYQWTIDEDVGNSGWSQGDKIIQYFTGVVYPYQYRLESWNYPGDELWIWLYIYPGIIDAQLPWPFSGKAAITVSDRSKREVLQKVIIQCKIRHPDDNQYSSTLFEFSHSSLIKAGLDLTDGVNVSCVIATTCTYQ